MTPKRTLPGVVITALAVLTLVAGAALWLDRLSPTIQASLVDKAANERHTAASLQQFIAAQDSYRQRGLGPGGRQEYATFFSHLWTAVGEDSRPIPLDYIPRELAFATGPSTAVAGYWYDDLHLKTLPNGERSPLEMTTEWAVYAMPAVQGESGDLTFVATKNGVWAKQVDNVLDAVPANFEDEGWEKLKF